VDWLEKGVKPQQLAGCIHDDLQMKIVRRYLSREEGWVEELSERAKFV